jgi:glutathione S-transferase
MLGESAAIIEYIAELYGDGRLILGPSSPDYADFLYWFHFANGSFVPAAMIESLARRIASEDGVMKALSGRLGRAYDQIESRLGAVPFLAGDSFTAADIMCLFPLTTMRAFSPRDLGPYPQIQAYLQRIAARPAFQRAMQQAEPDFKMPLT